MKYHIKCTISGELYAFDVIIEDLLRGSVVLERRQVAEFVRDIWRGGIEWNGHEPPEVAE